MITVTRRLEFDAGHRIPDHHSQCRNLHGHRYVIEITLEGEVLDAPGQSDNGMVMDFSAIKSIAKEHVVDPWDHAFLVYKHDTPVVNFLRELEGHKTVLVDKVPTAENLAQLAFNLLEPHFIHRYGVFLKLTRIRLYETPNCWVDANKSTA
ncbi:MAG: 6-carboxytetrahydropterin synthase QueD [Candidimonas sp.]|nr:MAG: 6-carboxytetrahydropterin synthase QueD [Candidimonas sp.]TAM26305.1 MAG: 6-carboxytetrahydropterin synthase QueD [Candidimonas sp.]TAM75117.1 MAG: 6-carboxytetrahydropterin synthase QueD [Candidimonas sp.]